VRQRRQSKPLDDSLNLILPAALAAQAQAVFHVAPDVGGKQRGSLEHCCHLSAQSQRRCAGWTICPRYLSVPLWEIPGSEQPQQGGLSRPARPTTAGFRPGGCRGVHLQHRARVIRFDDLAEFIQGAAFIGPSSELRDGQVDEKGQSQQHQRQADGKVEVARGVSNIIASSTPASNLEVAATIVTAPTSR
jgi:hypothetical protein